MKNNTVRAHRNGATKTASTQTKTARRAKTPSVSARNFSVAENDADLPMNGACILFYGHKQDRILASVPISADQLACLERHAANGALSLESYVQRGFVRMLAELEGKINVLGKAERVNEAAAQSNVLLELISNHLDAREHRAAEDFTGERADEFNFGLDSLIFNTNACLKKAVKEMMAAAYGKQPEVAS